MPIRHYVNRALRMLPAVAEKAASFDTLKQLVDARFNEELDRIGLTQTALGNLIGVHQSQISRFGKGRTLRLENLLPMLDVCARRGMNLSYVFGGVRGNHIETAGETAELRRELDELKAQVQTHIVPRPRHKAR